MMRDRRFWIAAGMACLLLLLAGASATDCSAINVSPVADFRFTVNPSETAPIAVNFYSLSQGGKAGAGPVADPIDTMLWTFGDGTSGTADNPLHTYQRSSARLSAADTPYSVTLMLKTTCGRVAAVTKDVPVYCLNQSPGFTIDPAPGDKPYTGPVALAIHDTTLHAQDAVTTWHYTVWDAGMTRLYFDSTEKDPTFILRNGGSYVIRQEVFKACSSIPPPGTTVEQTVEVAHSAAADAIPMDTLPVTLPGGGMLPVTTAAPTAAPAAEPAASGTGDLSIITSPPGAAVFVDDVPLGTSPAVFPDLAAGNHTLRLEKAGYRKMTALVGVDEGVVSEYSLALTPESSEFVVPLPLIAAVAVVILVAAGAAWYLRNRKPPKRKQQDGNALFLMDE